LFGSRLNALVLTMRMLRNTPQFKALHERVKAEPSVAAFLASPHGIAFNEDGIFRRYSELV
jgi:hypothetical protein